MFFISKLGICYADPDINLKIKYTKDAITVNVKEIKKIVKDNPQWLIPIAIPIKPKCPEQVKTASYDVAISILEQINSKYLKIYLPKIK